MACSWGKGSGPRCGQGRLAQQLPGNMSFRQDWPLQPCPETDCGDTTAEETEDETAATSDWDPCDESSLERRERSEPPGPLETFDERVRKLLEGNIWSNAVPPPKHQSTLPQVLKKAAAGLRKESEAYIADEVEFKNFAKRMMNIEKSFQFEQALKKAEEASATAPDEKIEEIALASARGFTMSMDTDRETTLTADGSTVVEVISYCGVTKPLPEHLENY